METKIWTEIKRQFPGKNNRALRERIFKQAQANKSVLGLERVIAFTARGKAGLRKVQESI